MQDALYITLYSVFGSQGNLGQGGRLQFLEGEEENYKNIHYYSHFVLEL